MKRPTHFFQVVIISITLIASSSSFAGGGFFGTVADYARQTMSQVLPNALPGHDAQCALSALGIGLPSQVSDIEGKKGDLLPYGKCFLSLSNKHELSINKGTGSIESLKNTCACERAKYSDESKIKSEAKDAIDKSYEEVLAKQARGTLLGQFNNLLFLSALIDEGSTNASVTALAPNCRLGKIFDSLESLSKRDDCKAKGEVFNRRFALMFGSSDFKKAKDDFFNLVDPILKNKMENKQCLPYRAYISKFATKDMGSPVKGGMKSGLAYGLKFLNMDSKYGKNYTQEDAAYYSDMIFHVHNVMGSEQGPPVNISEIKDEERAGKIQETLTFIDWNASMGFNLNVDRMQDDAVDPLLNVILNKPKLKAMYKRAIQEAVCEDERSKSPTPATFECRKLKFADLPNLKQYDSNFFKAAIFKSDLLKELGKEMDTKCESMTGLKKKRNMDDVSINNSIGKFLCEEELGKPSYSVFKTQIMPNLAGKVDTGEMSLYSVEYFKNNYCEKDPNTGEIQYPSVAYNNDIERVLDPVNRPRTDLELMEDPIRSNYSRYKKYNDIMCNVIDTHCKEEDRKNCYKGDTLGQILNKSGVEQIAGSVPSATRVDVRDFLEVMKGQIPGSVDFNPSTGVTTTIREVCEEGKGGEGSTCRVEKNVCDRQNVCTTQLISNSGSDTLFKEITPESTGGGAPDPVTYFATGTSEDQDVLEDYNRRVASGEIQRGSVPDIPTRDYTGNVVTTTDPVVDPPIIQPPLEPTPIISTKPDINRVVDADPGDKEKGKSGSSIGPIAPDSTDISSISVNNTDTGDSSDESSSITDYFNSEQPGDMVYSNDTPISNPSNSNNDDIMEQIRNAQSELRSAQEKTRTLRDDIFQKRWEEKYNLGGEDSSSSTATVKRGNTTGKSYSGNSNSGRSLAASIEGGEHSTVGDAYREMFETGEKPKDSNITGFDPKHGTHPRTGKRLNGEGSYMGGNLNVALSKGDIQKIMAKVDSGDDFDNFIKIYKSKMKKNDPTRPESWHDPFDYQFGLILPHSILMNIGLERAVDALGLEGKSFYTLNITKGVNGNIKVIKRRFDLKEDILSNKIERNDEDSARKYDFFREKFMKGVMILRSRPGGSPLLYQIRNSYVEVERVDLSGDYRQVAKLKEIERMMTRSTISATTQYAGDISVKAVLMWIEKHGAGPKLFSKK